MSDQTVPIGTGVMINRSPYTLREVYGEPHPSHKVVGHLPNGYLRIRPLQSSASAEKVAAGRYDTSIPQSDVITF